MGKLLGQDQNNKLWDFYIIKKTLVFIAFCEKIEGTTVHQNYTILYFNLFTLFSSAHQTFCESLLKDVF